MLNYSPLGTEKQSCLILLEIAVHFNFAYCSLVAGFTEVFTVMADQLTSQIPLMCSHKV